MEECIGSVIRSFDKNSVAVIMLDCGDLAAGDTIRLRGAATDVTRQIEVLEFDHKPVDKALRGQFTGIKLFRPARPFDLDDKVQG